MRRQRWGWRIAAISPVVVVLGLAGAGTALASGGSSNPSTCTTSGGLVGTLVGGVCQTVQAVTSPLPLPSPSSILPSPVASVVGSVGSTVGGTVGSLTGSSTGNGGSGSGSGSTSGSGSGTGSGSTGGHGKSSGGSKQPAAGGVSALGAAGTPNAAVLSSLGVPAWLVRGGLGALPGNTVPLSFPVVHPAGNGRTVAQEIRASNQPRAVSSLWLVFAVGVACLVGVAGGLGRFEGRRRVRRSPS